MRELPMRSAVGPGTGLCTGGILGKPVAPVIVLMGGVTFGPDPVRFVDRGQFVKFNPKVGVANRAVLFPPVAAFPPGYPERHSLPDILGVGRDFYFARLRNREEALNCRHQFHPVVSGLRIVPEEFLLHGTEAQETGPPSRTWIIQTGS